MSLGNTRTASAAVIALLASGFVFSAALSSQPPQPQRPPVFRTDAHYVRVDAYPSRDGKIIRGLTKGDFEILEDGRPQAIETFEYIDYSIPAPEAVRRDPNSQRDGFNLAADPRFRVFVLYLDVYHVNVFGSHTSRRPIVDLLNRILGPQDLFGVLTPRQVPMRDLLLARQTLSIEEQLAKHWTWGVSGRLIPEREPEEMALEACYNALVDGPLAATLITRRRLDKVFSDLEETVSILEGLRDERKNVILFSAGWTLPGSNMSLTPARPRTGPPIGITNAGKLTLGTRRPGEVDVGWCDAELNRLKPIDFTQRHRDLLSHARRANVTFYPVNPHGLEASATPAGMDTITLRGDRLRELADNTGGVPILDTNDLDAGLRRVADDLAGTYVLGYYTSNTKWDGRYRSITVRLKPSGDTVRARREYRAPTEAEMAALRNPPPATVATGPAPVDDALAALARLRPGGTMNAYARATASEIAVVAEIAAAHIERGRWRQGGELQAVVVAANGETVGVGRARFEPGTRGAIVRIPLGGQPGPWEAAVRLRADGEEAEEDRVAATPPSGILLGDPLVYRAAAAAAAPLRPVAGFRFRRTERVAIEWPVLAPLDRRSARILGRDGKPLALDVTLAEAAPGTLTAHLNLAPLTAGDYVVELTAGAAGTEERKLVAIRVVR